MIQNLAFWRKPQIKETKTRREKNVLSTKRQNENICIHTANWSLTNEMSRINLRLQREKTGETGELTGEKRLSLIMKRNEREFL